jgi:hypothetical protein
VGNAVTDDAYDGPGQVEYAMGHGLIDASTRDAVTETCEVGASARAHVCVCVCLCVCVCVCVCVCGCLLKLAAALGRVGLP